jgi:hypothetical protein
MTTNVDRSERLDPFVHEHEALHHTLGDLRWLLKERRSPERFASTFAEFADHVQAHFVHEEEEEGFFESVIDQAPRLKTRADALIEEHTSMSNELAKLRQQAEEDAGSADWWSTLSEQFETFWRLFCRHERAENDLMQEAFHDDIGAED